MNLTTTNTHTHTHAQHTDVCACVCECQKDYQKNCWKLSKQATELQKIKLKKKKKRFVRTFVTRGQGEKARKQ